MTRFRQVHDRREQLSDRELIEATLLIAIDTDERVDGSLHLILRSLHKIAEKIGVEMALIDDLNDAVAQTGIDAQDAADRVIATIEANATELATAQATIADLQTKLAEAIANDDATPEQLQAALDGINAIDANLKNIDLGASPDEDEEAPTP